MSSHIQQHQQEQHQQSSSYFVQYLFHLLWNVEEFRERVVSDQRGHVCTGIQKRNGEVKRSQKLPIGSNFNSQESVQKQGNGRLEEDEIPLELVHGSSKCIYCSLKESFIQLDKGKQKEQSFLDGVEGLDDLIKNEQFGLEKLNYDVEIYKALIDSLHFAIQGEMTKAQGCFPPCMVHNLLSLCIQPVPNSPLYFNNAFHSISVEELLKLEDFEKGSSSKLKDLSFKKLQNKIQAKLQAKNSNSFTKIKDYDEKEGEEEEDKSSNDGSEDDTDAETLSRGKKLSFSQLIQKVSHKNDSTSSPCLLNRPKLLTLRFIWDNTETSIIEFNTLWDLLSPVLNLDDIFSLDNEMNQNQSMKSKDENEKQPMILRGIICYDQNHSISFSYNLKTSEWYSLDNDTIKIIGTNWGDLMRSYPLGSLQPSLLFYHPCSKEVARNEKMKYFQDKSLANPFIISNGNFKEHNRMSIIPQYSQHIDDANGFFSFYSFFLFHYNFSKS